MKGMKPELIAPCGMNCRLCMAYQRVKKPCDGCRGSDVLKPSYCLNCVMRNCPEIKNSKTGLCHECSQFPCKRLKQLDKRYRTKYGMSMIENLQFIKAEGMDAFLLKQEKQWTCKACGAILSVHRDFCLCCKALHR